MNGYFGAYPLCKFYLLLLPTQFRVKADKPPNCVAFGTVRSASSENSNQYVRSGCSKTKENAKN